MMIVRNLLFCCSESAKKKDDIKVPEAMSLGDGDEELGMDVWRKFSLWNEWLFTVQHDGAIPIFISAPTQQIFECKTDDDVSASRPYKLIKKEDIMKDLFNRAAVCDFQPHKKIIEVDIL